MSYMSCVILLLIGSLCCSFGTTKTIPRSEEVPSNASANPENRINPLAPGRQEALTARQKRSQRDTKEYDEMFKTMSAESYNKALRVVIEKLRAGKLNAYDFQLPAFLLRPRPGRSLAMEPQLFDDMFDGAVGVDVTMDQDNDDAVVDAAIWNEIRASPFQLVNKKSDKSALYKPRLGKRISSTCN